MMVSCFPAGAAQQIVVVTRRSWTCKHVNNMWQSSAVELTLTLSLFIIVGLFVVHVFLLFLLFKKRRGKDSLDYFRLDILHVTGWKPNVFSSYLSAEVVLFLFFVLLFFLLPLFLLVSWYCIFIVLLLVYIWANELLVYYQPALRAASQQVGTCSPSHLPSSSSSSSSRPSA